MRKSIALLTAAIVGVLAAAVTVLVMNATFESRMRGSEDQLSLDEFAAVEGYIDQYYLGDYDMKQVQYAGLKAMVNSLGDPYSEYFTPEEFAAFQQSANGEYSGVGMLIAVDEETGMAVVDLVFSDSPAQEAGIRAGDLVVAIDGQDVTQMSLEEISLLSIGEVGTSVQMTLRRGGQDLVFDMVRREIQIDMLTYEMRGDGIGYMKISQFGGNCTALFEEAVRSFEENGARGMVIDLRDNPGGYLDTVTEVLDILLPEGTLVYTEDKYENRETETSDASSVHIPLVMIVNGNTASAAEIFTGAVQDFGYGEAVGTTTYGKGVVQIVQPIESTGGGVKLTISEYFTPNGRQINGNGIVPDYFVELPEGYYDDPVNSQDTQLIKALEVLEQRIADTEN